MFACTLYIVLIIAALPLGTKFQGNKQEKAAFLFWDGKETKMKNPYFQNNRF